MKTLRITEAELDSEGVYVGGADLTNWPGHIEIMFSQKHRRPIFLRSDVIARGDITCGGVEHPKTQTLHIQGRLEAKNLRLEAFLQTTGGVKAKTLRSNQSVATGEDLQIEGHILVKGLLNIIGAATSKKGRIEAWTSISVRSLQCPGDVLVSGSRGAVFAEGDIKVGGRIILDGGIYADGDLSMSGAEAGRLSVKGNVSAREGIFVLEYLQVGGGIEAELSIITEQGGIKVGGSIVSRHGWIIAGGPDCDLEGQIIAGGDVTAAKGVKAITIECGGEIKEGEPGGPSETAPKKLLALTRQQ